MPSAFYGKTAHKSQRKSVVRFISLFVTSEIAAVQVADHSSLASAGGGRYWLAAGAAAVVLGPLFWTAPGFSLRSG